MFWWRNVRECLDREKKLKALIDTGSEISVIQSDTLKEALGIRNLEGSPYDKVISGGGLAAPI